MSSQPVAMAPEPAPMSPRRCRAHSSQSGQPCRAYATRGATVCVTHGGAAGQVKAKARDRLAQAKVGAFLAAQGDETDGDPLDILLRQLSVSDAVTERVRALVAELDEIVCANHHGDDKPHAYVKLWAEWADRTARLAKLGMDNGLAEKAIERLARISERQGEDMVETFTASMDDPELNLSPEQKGAARKAVARHLRSTDKE